MLFLMIRIIQLYIHWVGNCYTITGICVQQVYEKHNIGKMAQPNLGKKATSGIMQVPVT